MSNIELCTKFLLSSDIQLLGGLNYIMSKKDDRWSTDDCYQCRNNLLKLSCDVAIVRLADGSLVYCCAHCRDLTAKVNARRIELRDAMSQK